MKTRTSFCLMAILIILGFAMQTRGETDVGEAGSVQDVFSVKVAKFELRNDNGGYVTIYEGNDYLDTIGSGSSSIASILGAKYPPAGVYNGYRLTLGGFQIKATIVRGGTTYFTTEQSVEIKNENWNLSTLSSEYGIVSVNYPSPSIELHDFITPITVSGHQTLNIAWVLQRNGNIMYEFKNSSDPMGTVDYAKEEDVVRTFVTDKVSYLVQLPFVVTLSAGGTRTNTISMLLDKQGKLLGGFCHRPSIKALNCNDLVFPSSLIELGGGLPNQFNLSFDDGDDTGGVYYISGKYDCTAGTTAEIQYNSSGSVSEYFNTNAGDTIETSGTVSCTPIN